MAAPASAVARTLDDFHTPIERANHLAETINVDVSSFPIHEPGEIVDQTLALLFLTGGVDEPLQEHMIIRDDAEDEDRAAAIVFAVSIVTVFRDVAPSIWHRSMCRLGTSRRTRRCAWLADGSTRLRRWHSRSSRGTRCEPARPGRSFRCRRVGSLTPENFPEPR